MVYNAGLTPTTAAVMRGNYNASNAEEIKQAISTQLGEMLRKGQVSEAEVKAAMEYLDNNTAEALVRMKNVEGTYSESLNGLEDLPDKKADKLMKSAGLTIDDLYQASKLAGPEYEVSYTYLNKDELIAAENGEITASELKNIQNNLNAKIKARGGDKVLSDKEVKQLMVGLGLSVESRFNAGEIIKSAFRNIIGFSGKSDNKVVNTETVTKGIVKGVVYAGIGLGAGVFVNGFLGAAKEASVQGHRAETGKKESDGTTTNPIEEKMDEINRMADIANSQVPNAAEQDEKTNDT